MSHPHGYPPPDWQQMYAPPQKQGWVRRHPILAALITAVVILVLCGACTVVVLGGAANEISKSTNKKSTLVSGDKGLPAGIYHFGSTVKFTDGSTLTAGKPHAYKPEDAAFAEKNYKYAIQIPLAFVNHSGQTADLDLTTDQLVSQDTEGVSIFDGNNSSPENKILNGRRVRWGIAYGVKNPKKVTLTINIGFLDYADVVFTSEQ